MSDETLDLICELRFGRKPLKRAQRMKVADLLERASDPAQSALLDRVRSECEVFTRELLLDETARQPVSMIEIEGPTDLLRQFAERLKQD